MPLVSEMRHPRGLDFANERLVYRLRQDEGLSFDAIAARVVNISGEPSTEDTVRRAFSRFRLRQGRCKYNFDKCGRKPWKLTPDVQRFVLQRLLQMRKTTVCTSVSLQAILAAEKGVDVADSTIRKLLKSKGYKWLPRAQKRAYSKADKQRRLKFARAILRLSKQMLREKLTLSMDGVVLPTPPTDPIDRLNFCRQGETHMYRKPSEAGTPALAGADPYEDYIPLQRCVPLWGGISEGGCAEVLMHEKKKLTISEWVAAVSKGRLNDAVRKLRPQGGKPWHVLCDNEKFLVSESSKQACAKKGIKLWFVPPRSPDLNPVERFWSWLRRELRRRDLLDLKQKRPVLGKTAYRQRVRSILRTRKAEIAAGNMARGLREVCRRVVKNKGAHSGK